jgi:hypothetical protein
MLLVLEYVGAKLEIDHLEERTHHHSLTALRGQRETSNYLKETLPEGRAIAQAVSCQLSTLAARVQTRIWSCGIL